MCAVWYDLGDNLPGTSPIDRMPETRYRAHSIDCSSGLLRATQAYPYERRRPPFGLGRHSDDVSGSHLHNSPIFVLHTPHTITAPTVFIALEMDFQRRLSYWQPFLMVFNNRSLRGNPLPKIWSSFDHLRLNLRVYVQNWEYILKLQHKCLTLIINVQLFSVNGERWMYMLNIWQYIFNFDYLHSSVGN